MLFALKTCNQDISKTITASSFNFDQLIEDYKYINLVKIEKIQLLPFCKFGYLKKVIRAIALLQIWVLKTCNQDISKIIEASSFKNGQLTEDYK